MATDSRSRYLVKVFALFVAYFIAAWLGLKVGAVSTFATLIWPPSGIALSALVIGGIGLWPGIAISATLVNWFLGAPPLVALGMATGNTLEAVMGASFLQWVGFQRPLGRLRDVYALTVLAGFLSTLISASVGVSSLYLGRMISASDFHSAWAAWWFGDVMGDLVIAPFLLVWSTPLKINRIPLLRGLELIAFGAVMVTGSLFFLTDLLGTGSVLFPHAYLIFPLLMLVALRLDQRWTATAVLTVTAITLWATAAGHGRFQGDSLSLRLFQAQIFLGVVSISTIVLAAAMMERRLRENESTRLYREANDAVHARDDFLSIASHELRTPLTSLSLQLQIFNRGIKRSIAEWEKKAESEKTETVSVPIKTAALVSACEEQIKKLVALLDNLLDLTRIRSGKLQLTPENVDLCEIVEAVMEQFRVGATAVGVDISVRCASDAHGFWDRMRVEQIVTNLVSNALKYGERRPVSIVIEKDVPRRLIRLAVEDHGLGIRPEMRGKLFERFERAGINSKNISGLGLGLYISRQFVEAHGGHIYIDSEWGKGSTFTVELPTNHPLGV